MDVIIFYVIMVLGATYLEEGGPNKDSYACPVYCAANHKHLAFKDTTVVYSNMAKNDNTGFLSGLFNLIGGKQGTEIDALPVGESSFDNLKEMKRNVDTRQQQLLAKSTAVNDMRDEGVSEEIISSVMPRSEPIGQSYEVEPEIGQSFETIVNPPYNKAFETMAPDNTRVDTLVKEAEQDITKPMDMADVWGAVYQSESDTDKMDLFREHQKDFKDPYKKESLHNISNVADIAGDVFDGDEGISGGKLANLLYATGAHESGGGKWDKQKGGGPALGYFQVEPKTAKDLIKNSSAYFGPKAKAHFKTILGKDVNLSNISDKDLESLLMSDLGSAIFAGAKYLAGAKTKGSAYLNYLK